MTHFYFSRAWCRFHCSNRPTLLLGIFALAMTLFTPLRSHAVLVVNPGWSLLHSGPGTSFVNQPFSGVPLGSFDFGGSTGVHGVGNADAIVQRLSQASVASPGDSTSIPIALVALQLVSVNPIDFGAGLGDHYITLQSVRGGPTSSGRMSITFDDNQGGTFDSFFDIFFDIRLGSLNGPIIFSDMSRFSSDGATWGRIPPPGAVEIPDVNTFLNGSDRNADFWPESFRQVGPPGAIYDVETALVPEPGTLALFSLGTMALLRCRRRTRKNAA